MGTNARSAWGRARGGCLAFVIGLPVIVLALAALGVNDSALGVTAQLISLGFVVWLVRRVSPLAMEGTNWRSLGWRESALPGLAMFVLILIVVFGGAWAIRWIAPE